MRAWPWRMRPTRPPAVRLLVQRQSAHLSRRPLPKMLPPPMPVRRNWAPPTPRQPRRMRPKMMRSTRRSLAGRRGSTAQAKARALRRCLQRLQAWRQTSLRPSADCWPQTKPQLRTWPALPVSPVPPQAALSAGKRLRPLPRLFPARDQWSPDGGRQSCLPRHLAQTRHQTRHRHWACPCRTCPRRRPSRFLLLPKSG